jgi:hypothetical protein
MMPTLGVDRKGGIACVRLVRIGQRSHHMARDLGAIPGAAVLGRGLKPMGRLRC